MGFTLDASPRAALPGGGLTGRGDALVDGATRVIEGWASSSNFLASLDLAGRMSLLDPDIPVAALGAAALGEAGRDGAGMEDHRG